MNTFYKFPMLSFDLSIYIHKHRQNTATNTIITNWFNHIARKVIAINLISRIIISQDVTYNYNPYINYTHLNVLSSLNYCNRVLTGNEDIEWWTRKIIQLVSYFNYKINNNNTYVYDEYPQKILILCCKIFTKFYPNHNTPWEHTQLISFINTNNIIDDLYYLNNI